MNSSISNAASTADNIASNRSTIVPGGADVVRRLHQHRLWANVRLLMAAAALTDDQLRRDFPIGPGSVLKTLAHLFAAEEVWLAALKSEPTARFRQDDFTTLDPLAAAWRDLDGRWREYLAALRDVDLAKPATRISATGLKTTVPALDILLHVCDHGAYHAAQLTNMLRQVGADPLPNRAFITMSREEHGR